MTVLSPSEMDPTTSSALTEVLAAYSKEYGGIQPDYKVLNRPDGPFLVFEFALPGERHFRIHNAAIDRLSEQNIFRYRSSVGRRKIAPANRLQMPETRMLTKEISESLTIDQHSFGDEFFNRYTASVTDFEQVVTARSNYLLYGRRGAGKSSLLAYAMHVAKRNGDPFSWVAMQAFARGRDIGVVAEVCAEILNGISDKRNFGEEIASIAKSLDDLAERSERDDISRSLDREMLKIRRVISRIATQEKPFTIFLDDLHVVAQELQPHVLGYIYKFSRGNNCYIKASGIDQFSRAWDNELQTGLQVPGDAVQLHLDRNLTQPQKSKEHIVGILDSHAQFCGLPDISYLSGDDVLSRLVLVAAGVPRDAMSLFSKAISKASAKSQRRVSLTSVNIAASDMAEEKLKEIDVDSGGTTLELRGMLEEVIEFCVKRNRKNAFLMRSDYGNLRFNLVQKLVALRVVHILNEGVTPGRAGERFIALMLDYGFYFGLRAARSVELIPAKPVELSAKELRFLPRFE
ncbi:MAG: ATP-binding protein [Magnetospirillum sp.]|nr:ATP-binding protein [Magnetospirillum sp.]